MSPSGIVSKWSNYMSLAHISPKFEALSMLEITLSFHLIIPRSSFSENGINGWNIPKFDRHFPIFSMPFSDFPSIPVVRCSVALWWSDWSGLSSWISWSALRGCQGRLQGYQRGTEGSIIPENLGKILGKWWENGWENA
jgi:hypothetical protein